MKVNSKYIICSKITLLICGLLVCVQSVKGAALTELPGPISPGRVRDILAPKKPRDLDALEKQIEEQKKEPAVKAKPSLPKEDVEVVKFRLSKIIVSGVTAYKKGELQQYYKPYLGKDVSLNNLQDIANAITARYRKDGYVISRAVVPTQKILDGKADIQVIEGYVEEFYIEGEVKKARRQIEKCGEKIKKLRPLQIKEMERYILLLNDVPGLVVKTVLSPAVSATGGADLTFVADQQRVTGGLRYDNLGSRYMGPEEIFANVSIGDIALPVDNLLLQTIATPFHDEMRYAQLKYAWPMGINGLRFGVGGGFALTKAGFVLKSSDFVGRSKGWNMNVEYPLLRSRAKNLWLYGKFDWLDAYTDSNSSPVFQDHIRSVRLRVEYDWSDKWSGANFIDLEYSKGFHIFGASPLYPGTPLTRNVGASDYKKIVGNISRYQMFGSRWILLGAVSGQYAFNNRLLSAEEFAFGGSLFGRAYDTSEVVGDCGIDGKLELRADTYPDLRFLQQIQYYTYYEIGVLWNEAADYTQLTKDSAADLGIGMRVNFNDKFYGNFELAKPLTRDVDTQVLSDKNGRGVRVFFGLGFNF